MIRQSLKSLFRHHPCSLLTAGQDLVASPKCQSRSVVTLLRDNHTRNIGNFYDGGYQETLFCLAIHGGGPHLPFSLRPFSTDYSSSSSSESNSKIRESEAEFGSVEDIRCAVLDASLCFVPEFGWTEECIAKGAESLGYSAMAHGMVQGGGGELFLHLQRRLHDQWEDKMQSSEEPAHNCSPLEAALQRRLALTAPYREVWASGAAALALHSPSDALYCLAQIADTACAYHGHGGIGPSWYAERAAVAATYSAAELCLLQDTSPDHEDSRQFLHRRVTELLQCRDALRGVEVAAADTTSVMRAAVATGLNMLGMNDKSR